MIFFSTFLKGNASSLFLFFLPDKASGLKSLRLISCKKISDESVVQTVISQPLLEELEITLGLCTAKLRKLIGEELPNLKRFVFNGFYNHPPFSEEEDLANCELAFGIGKTMHELRHLQIVGNRLSNKGLKPILEGCPHLEILDIRKCNNLNMDESDLQAQCTRLRFIRLPDDSLADLSGFFSSLLGATANYIFGGFVDLSDIDDMFM
ncbi:hypothetical protein LUZ60_005007 [Juncus effusus]|nr:hypothetical protein LUZ60_005007 [Juncus effusus]